jgi:hypothetical protein
MGYRETAIEVPAEGEGCRAIFYQSNQSTNQDDRTSDTVGNFRESPADSLQICHLIKRLPCSYSRRRPLIKARSAASPEFHEGFAWLAL